MHSLVSTFYGVVVALVKVQPWEKWINMSAKIDNRMREFLGVSSFLAKERLLKSSNMAAGGTWVLLNLIVSRKIFAFSMIITLL